MLAIIGAGGHAKCVYECLTMSGYRVAGFYDDDPAKLGEIIIGNTKVMGRPELIFEHRDIEGIFVAIGDNSRRLDINRRFAREGYMMPNALHRQVSISAFASTGKGNFIMAGAVITPGAEVDDYCIVNTAATVDHDCILSRGVQIGPGVNLAGASRLKEGVFVGTGAKVAPGVTIGEWAVVGAGAVVLNDIAPHSFCCGVPAKVREDHR